MKTHTSKQKHPNILYILPDQWRREAMGRLGSDPVITPHIDQLSRESTSLPNMFSNRPICTPYRAMFLTGQYPVKNGVWGNCNSNTSYDLNEQTECLSDTLSNIGYNCGYIGKWHLNHPQLSREEALEYTGGAREDGRIWDTFVPPGKKRHSFDYWYSYNCCDTHLNPHYWTQEGDVTDVIHPRQWSAQHECDKAIEYIENKNHDLRDSDKPWFLVLSPNPPHPPYTEVPAHYLDHYQDQHHTDLLNRDNVDFHNATGGYAAQMARYYFAAITGVDEQIGRVLQTLEAQGLKDDTICIFTSDHGELMGSHNRMQKGPNYEESTGVPFLIRWPTHIKENAINDLALNVPDLFPTLLGLIGQSENIPESVEGENRAEHILGLKQAERQSSLYLNINEGEATIDQRGIRTPRYTYVKERDKKSNTITAITLFDREIDPYELNNIAGSDDAKEALAFCEAELHYWLEKTNDPWLKNAGKTD